MPSKPVCSLLSYYKDEERFLKAMIESAIDAMDACPVPCELVLLDNGSTDKSREIAHSFADPRLVFVDFDEDISGPDLDFGHENTVAFEACSGDYVAIVGGDDMVFPDRLAHQVRCFEQDPELDVVHAGALHINEHSDLISTRFTSPPYHQWNFLRIMFSYNVVAYPTTMIKRESWLKLGGFKGGYAPDFWLWLETARTWKYRYLPENILYYRVHDRSASHSAEGSRRCSDRTVLLRSEFRAKYGIEDFFPEIALCDDKKLATAAAYLELGNMMMGGGMANSALAFAEYKKADDILNDHPAVIHNAAVCLALDGQFDNALAAFATLPDNPHVSHSKMVTKGLIRQPFALADGRGISSDLYRVKLPPGLWKSDGTVTV